jgi:hypothetical protein
VSSDGPRRDDRRIVVQDRVRRLDGESSRVGVEAKAKLTPPLLDQRGEPVGEGLGCQVPLVLSP